MVRNDLGYKKQNMGGEKVLFHKVIFHSYEDAINILKSRNLAPGEMAVARYYVGYDDTTIPPSWDYIRMVLAIGGATPNSNDDTYFFKDFTNKNGNEFVSFDELEESLSNYYTKDEIAKLLNDDTAWKELVNITLDGIKENIINIENDIDTLRKEIGSGSTSDLENYYTKTEVDGLLSKKLESNDVSIYAKSSDVYTKQDVEDKIDSIEIPDVSNFVTNEDLNKVNNKLDEKVDSSYVEDYFTNNVKDTVENEIKNAIDSSYIEDKVNNAIEEALNGIEPVTTDTIDDVLKNDGYFNTTVITPISTIETQITEIQTQIKDLAADIDGGEEEEWSI